MTAAIDPKYEEAILATIPLARYGKAEEVAGLARFLALDPGGWAGGCGGPWLAGFGGGWVAAGGVLAVACGSCCLASCLPAGLHHAAWLAADGQRWSRATCVCVCG